MKSYLLNLSLFMISLFVGIIILEIGIRVIFPQFVPDGESRYNYDYTNKIVLGDANAAALWGLISYIRGARSVTWTTVR